MNIGVNSRFYLQRGSGVPNYVACLYRKCLELDSANQYLFFQPNGSRTLGATRSAWVPGGLAGDALFDTIRVDGLIGQAGLDLFHAPAHVMPFRKRPGTKYVVTMHDLATRVMPFQYGWKHRWYYAWQVPRALKLADAVISVSHNTKRDILRFYPMPEERIHVIHLGVAEHFLKPFNPAEPRLIPERYFFSITTHPKRKNIPGALQAFARLPRRQELKFVIAGIIDKEQRDELCRQAEALGLRERMLLFGYADDRQLANLYRNAEFLIFPSFYEGFGFPLIEAMACGCPVITSNTSSLPEIVSDERWLVNPRAIDDIAAKMNAMLALSQDQRADLIAKNLARVQHHFTWQRAARETIDLFNRLAGRA